MVDSCSFASTVMTSSFAAAFASALAPFPTPGVLGVLVAVLFVIDAAKDVDVEPDILVPVVVHAKAGENDVAEGTMPVVNMCCAVVEVLEAFVPDVILVAVRGIVEVLEDFDVEVTLVAVLGIEADVVMFCTGAGAGCGDGFGVGLGVGTGRQKLYGVGLGGGLGVGFGARDGNGNRCEDAQHKDVPPLATMYWHPSLQACTVVWFERNMSSHNAKHSPWS